MNTDYGELKEADWGFLFLDLKAIELVVRLKYNRRCWLGFLGASWNRQEAKVCDICLSVWSFGYRTKTNYILHLSSFLD